MKLLVPLPFDVSDLAHGRNLRVVNLLAHLPPHVELTVLVEDVRRAASACQQLPNADVFIADETNNSSLFGLPQQFSYTQRCLAYYVDSLRLAHAVSRTASRFDAVLGFDFVSLPCLMAARECSSQTVVFCDVIDDPWLTWKSMPMQERFCGEGIKSAVAMHHLRRAALSKLTGVFTAGPRDADSLRAAGVPDVHVVANGVDVEPPHCLELSREPLAVFTGYMSFAPNEQAAMYLLDRIWPQVQSELEKHGSECVRLALVGAEPSRRLRRAANRLGVEVTGRVDSIREWLLRARIAIAPMRNGSGIKNKILEACACACPVVTTPCGGDGLPAGEETGILVHRSPADLARECIDLLANPRRAATLGSAAYACVRDEFTWSNMANLMTDVMASRLGDSDLLLARSMPLNVELGEPARESIMTPTKETLIDAAS